MISTDPNQALRNTIAVSTAFLPVSETFLLLGSALSPPPERPDFVNTTNSWPLAGNNLRADGFLF